MSAQFYRSTISFAFLCLILLLMPGLASAQTVSFDVYASTNATGCVVTLPSGGTLNSINSRITATVDTGSLMVTDVSIAQCNGVGFDPGVTTNANFPVGLNVGVGGADVVELSAPFDLLGPRSNRVQLFIVSNNPMSTAFDELLTTTGAPGDPAIVVALPFAIPVNNPWVLALMATLLVTGGFLVIRKRRMLTGVSLMLFSSIVIAAGFVVDGNVGDWTGEIQQGSDPLADTSVTDNAVDLVGFFGAVEGVDFFARIDVVDLENNPPVANAGTDTTLEDTAIVLTVTGSDIDGDPLTFAVDTPPANGSLGAFTVVNATTSNVTYTPNADFNGADQFLFVANDGQANSMPATFDVTVTPVNDAPVFTVGADETVLEDSGAQTVASWATGIAAGPATATDETGQVLTFNITANDNVALFSVQPAVASDGTLTYTPAADANGTANITLELMDDGGTANGGVDTSPTQTFAINVTAVNDEPSFTVGADETVLEDAGAQSVAAWATGISAGPPDEAGQVLTFNITANDNPALFSAGPAVAADGTLTYTTAADANGTANITLELMDDGGTANGGDDTSPTQSFMITVTAVNDAPEFTVGADETVLEDSGAQTVANWATGIMAGPATATDETGQVLTFNITANDNMALFDVQPVVATDGTLTYTPAADANGTANITLELMDDGGTANGGVDTSAGQTFAINVTAVNDEPSFTVGADETVLEDAGAQTVAAWAMGISPGPADEAGQTVNFNITANTNAALFSAGPAVASDGTLTYTPAADANGSATITLEAMDDGGTANGGDDTSPTQSFMITVTAVNDAPVFTAGADETVLEDAGAQTVATWATGIAAGPADEAGQTLTFNITANDNMALFSVQPAVASDGTLTYTPAANANGTANITLELMDNGGTANGGVDTSAGQTFAINVTPVNDQPSFTAGPDQTAASGSGPQLVAGWATGFDPGPGEAGQMVLMYNVSVTSNPGIFATAPAVAANGDLTFEPVATLAMDTTAMVQINVQDDGGTANGGVDTSANQTFMITITVPPPLLMDDAYNATGNVRLSHPDNAMDLFANDNFGGGTLDNASLTSTQGGQVNINADGSFTYNPPPGFEGMDDFTYSVTNTAGTSMATATITVSDMIWFIDAATACPCDGRLTNPFMDFGGAGAGSFNATASDDAGDAIFLEQGAYTGGVTLLNNQIVVGDGATTTLSAITGITPAANSDALPAFSGVRPVVTGGAANGITLGSGNTIRGLDVSNSVSMIAGTNFGTASISEVALNGTGEAIDLDTGTAAVTLDSVSSTNSASEGIRLNSVAGSFAVTGATSVTNPAQIGVNINTSSTSYSFGDVTVNNRNSSGVFINGFNSGAQNGTFGNVVINNQNAVGTTAFGIDNSNQGNGTITITSLNINNNGGTGSAVAFSNNDMTSINVNGGAVSNSNGATVSLSSSAGTVNFAPTITNNSARSLQILNNEAGGIVNISGVIDDNAQGIFIDNNAGATVNFTGGMDLDTTTNTAFNATNGGTVNVSGGVNTVDTTTGIGVNIVNTTIGGTGVTFRLVNVNGASSGIILDTTGMGAFTVEGDGSGAQNGSGGTIQNTTNHAIVLDTAANVTLRSMNISNPGNAANENGINAVEIGGSNQVIGGVFTGQGTPSSDYIRVTNMATNMTLFEVNNSDFTGVTNGGNDAILFNMSGPITTRLDVINNNMFDGLLGDGVQVIAGPLSNVTANINLNRFSNDSNLQPGGVGGNSASRLSMATSDGVLTANVTNNVLFDSGVQSGALPVGLVGVYDVVNNQGGASMIIANGNTISNIEEDGGTRFIGDDNTLLMRLQIDNNTMDDINEPGIFFQPRDNTVEADLTVRNNMIGVTTPVGTENANFNEDTIRLFVENAAGAASGVDILIEDNTLVNNSSSQGIDGDFEDTSTTNLTVHGNTITNNGMGGEAFDLEADNGGFICLDMNSDNNVGDGNTITDGPATANSELHHQNDGGGFQIENLVGGVAGFITGNNTFAGTLDVVAGLPFTVGPAECTLPTLP